MLKRKIFEDILNWNEIQFAKHRSKNSLEDMRNEGTIAEQNNTLPLISARTIEQLDAERREQRHEQRRQARINAQNLRLQRRQSKNKLN